MRCDEEEVNPDATETIRLKFRFHRLQVGVQWRNEQRGSSHFQASRIFRPPTLRVKTPLCRSSAREINFWKHFNTSKSMFNYIDFDQPYLQSGVERASQ